MPIPNLYLRTTFLPPLAIVAAASAVWMPYATAQDMQAGLALNLSPISGMAIVAQEKGFFEANGLSIHQSNFTSGRQALNAVLGDAAEIATTAEAPITAAAMAGQPIAVLARMEYSDLKTLTRVEAGINSLADLKGKRLAFTAGTGSEVYTTELLKKAGLTASDVQLVNLRPQDMLAAFASGDIDAYNTWEPHISNGLKTFSDTAAELDTAGIYSETFNIVVMQAYLEQNPELISAFLQGLIDAEEWMEGNRDEAVALVAQSVNMSSEDLSVIWDDYVFDLTLDQRQIDILTANAQWRLDTGNHSPGAVMPDFFKVIFPEPLGAIDPERIRGPF